MSKPIITSEKLYSTSIYPDEACHVNGGVIHKIFNFLFDKSNDSTTLNNVKQNIYLERNQFIQWEQIREQYEMLNLTTVEIAENKKLIKKLDRKVLQLNTGFMPLLGKKNMITHDKNFFLTMLQLRGKVPTL